MRSPVAIGLLAVSFGCRGPAELLVQQGEWMGEGCSALAWRHEGSVVELDTNECSPIRLQHALAQRLRKGDALEWVWWHDFLFAEEEAVGTVRLSVEGELLYEAAVGIPGPPNTFRETFDSPVAGEVLTVEIDNHGANTWVLGALRRL